MTKTYVVFVGRKPGIYDKWSDAHAQVYRFPGSCYKGYNSREEAHEAFDQKRVEEPQVSEGTCSSSTSTATSGGRVNQSRNLATCLEAQSELASEIRTLCLSMEKLCEEIKQELDGKH